VTVPDECTPAPRALVIVSAALGLITAPGAAQIPDAAPAPPALRAEVLSPASTPACEGLRVFPDQEVTVRAWWALPAGAGLPEGLETSLAGARLVLRPMESEVPVDVEAVTDLYPVATFPPVPAEARVRFLVPASLVPGTYKAWVEAPGAVGEPLVSDAFPLLAGPAQADADLTCQIERAHDAAMTRADWDALLQAASALAALDAAPANVRARRLARVAVVAEKLGRVEVASDAIDQAIGACEADAACVTALAEAVAGWRAARERLETGDVAGTAIAP
jgi:hypothetical protein